MCEKISSNFVLLDAKPDPKIRISALWSSFMFMYIYVDYFHLYMPGSLRDIMHGRVFTFEINQVFTLLSLASVTLPALMIFLSASLPANVNRRVNIVVAALYIPYSLLNLVGQAWIHMFLGAGIETAILALVIRAAWMWPRVEVQTPVSGSTKRTGLDQIDGASSPTFYNITNMRNYY